MNDLFRAITCNKPLREKCPNMKLFMVRIFLYSDWIRRDTEYLITEYSVRIQENTDQK